MALNDPQYGNRRGSLIEELCQGALNSVEIAVGDGQGQIVERLLRIVSDTGSDIVQTDERSGSHIEDELFQLAHCELPIAQQQIRQQGFGIPIDGEAGVGQTCAYGIAPSRPASPCSRVMRPQPAISRTPGEGSIGGPGRPASKITSPAFGPSRSWRTAGAIVSPASRTRTTRSPPNKGMLAASSDSRGGSLDRSAGDKVTSPNESASLPSLPLIRARQRWRTRPVSGPVDEDGNNLRIRAGNKGIDAVRRDLHGIRPRAGNTGPVGCGYPHSTGAVRGHERRARWKSSRTRRPRC